MRPDIDNLASIARAADDEIARERQAEAEARQRRADTRLSRAMECARDGAGPPSRNRRTTEAARGSDGDCASGVHPVLALRGLRQAGAFRICHFVGATGLGVAPEDRYLVPLCGPATIWNDCCHSHLHYLGPRRFWSELGIDPLDLARRLWRLSGDLEAGAAAVRFAQGIAFRVRRGEGARP